MAMTHSTRPLSMFLDTGIDFLQQKREDLRKAMARRRVYRKTLQELTALNDRELADLGIPRNHIKRLAQETANGC